MLCIICSTAGKGRKPRLWNIQKLGAVTLYDPANMEGGLTITRLLLLML